MFQHDLIVRLIWQRMLYAIRTRTVVKLISKLLRRWLGLSLNAFPPRLDYTFDKLPYANQFAGGVL